MAVRIAMSFAFVLVLACAGIAGSTRGGVREVIQEAAGKKVRLDSVKESGPRLRIEGAAPAHEDVADFMRTLSAFVSTPRGIGRQVSKAGITTQVELRDATVMEFPSSDVRKVCEKLELERAEQVPVSSNRIEISFALTCVRPAPATDAGVRLKAGEVCGGRMTGVGGPKSAGPSCAAGLVCCYPATGVYDPNARAFCVPPCAGGSQFCTGGCYSPPVP